jgi:hypothetical protein
MTAHSSKEKARPRWGGNKHVCATVVCATFIFAMTGGQIRADQVVMKNGDRYSGSVLSVDAESVVIQSELLGKVTLPRARTTLITVGSNAPASLARPATPAKAVVSHPSAASPNTNSFGAVDIRSLLAKTNLVQQVREQYLSAAGPEANKKFDEMLGDLMSGKLTLDGLRAQASSAADQLRAAKREVGGGDVSELDECLTILEHFLNETAPPRGTSPAPAAKSTGSRLNSDLDIE